MNGSVGGLPPRNVKHGNKAASKHPKRKWFIGMALVVIVMAAAVVGWYFKGGTSPVLEPSEKQEVNESQEKTDSDDTDSIPESDDEGPVPEPDSPETVETDEEKKASNQEEDDAPSDSKSGAETRIVTHKVRSGETLYRITMKYYHKKHYVDFLAAYNNLEDPREIYTGQAIKIPMPPPSK